MAYRKRSRVTMPANHSDRDAEWIESKLIALSPAHQLRARTAYSEAYSDAYKSTEVQHKKENAARKEANNRLRVFSAKCLEVYAQSPTTSIKKARESVQSGFTGF